MSSLPDAQRGGNSPLVHMFRLRIVEIDLLRHKRLPDL